MCRDCWAKAGEPADWTLQTEDLIELIGDLYAIHAVGGPLHVQLDDWNLHGTIEPYYDCYTAEELDALYWRGTPLAELDPGAPVVVENLGRSMRSLCEEIAEILNGMTEAERYAALAYADGFVERPA